MSSVASSTASSRCCLPDLAYTHCTWRRSMATSWRSMTISTANSSPPSADSEKSCSRYPDDISGTHRVGQDGSASPPPRTSSTWTSVGMCDGGVSDSLRESMAARKLILGSKTTLTSTMTARIPNAPATESLSAVMPMASWPSGTKMAGMRARGRRRRSEASQGRRRRRGCCCCCCC